jgi:hypothetical protein
MGIRRQTVEHPFGTLKAWMGSIHFLTKTLEKVRAEMSLHVLEHVPKKMLDVFNENMLQLFEFERFLFDRVMPHDRETL